MSGQRIHGKVQSRMRIVPLGPKGGENAGEGVENAGEDAAAVEDDGNGDEPTAEPSTRAETADGTPEEDDPFQD